MAGEAGEISSLGVKLTLDAKQYVSGMRTAKEETNAFTKAAEQAAQGAAHMQAGGGKSSTRSGAAQKMGVDVSLSVSEAALTSLRSQIQKSLQNIPITVSVQGSQAAGRASAAAIGAVTGMTVQQSERTLSSVSQRNYGGAANWVGPRRASGGPVAARQGVLVGELRPEVFVPKTPGIIEPSVADFYRKQEQARREEMRLAVIDQAQQILHQQRMGGMVRRARFGQRVAPLPPGQKMPGNEAYQDMAMGYDQFVADAWRSRGRLRRAATGIFASTMRPSLGSIPDVFAAERARRQIPRVRWWDEHAASSFRGMGLPATGSMPLLGGYLGDIEPSIYMRTPEGTPPSMMRRMAALAGMQGYAGDEQQEATIWAAVGRRSMEHMGVRPNATQVSLWMPHQNLRGLERLRRLISQRGLEGGYSISQRPDRTHLQFLMNKGMLGDVGGAPALRERVNDLAAALGVGASVTQRRAYMEVLNRAPGVGEYMYPDLRYDEALAGDSVFAKILRENMPGARSGVCGMCGGGHVTAMCGGGIVRASTGLRGIEARLSRRQRSYTSNLRAAARAFTPEDIAGGKRWYLDAQEFVNSTAAAHGMPAKIIGGALAALSASTEWQSNQTKLLRMLQGRRYDPAFNPHAKAAHILDSYAADPSYDPWDVLGHTPKTGQFYLNVMGDLDALTLDRWAIRAGTRGALDQLGHGPVRRGLDRAYRKVAKEMGLAPAEFQAAAWLYEKANRKGLRGALSGLAGVKPSRLVASYRPYGFFPAQRIDRHDVVTGEAMDEMRVPGQMSSMIDQIRGQGIEHALTFTSRGRLLGHAIGEEGSVEPASITGRPWWVSPSNQRYGFGRDYVDTPRGIIPRLRPMLDLIGTRTVHNHPGSGYQTWRPSAGDVEMMLSSGLNESWVVTPNHSFLMRPGAAAQSLGQMNPFNPLGGFKTPADIVIGKLKGEVGSLPHEDLIDLVNSRRYSVDQRFWHEAMAKMSDQFDFEWEHWIHPRQPRGRQLRLPGMAGGGRALDGVYLVGEIGEELFVPDSLAHLVPKKVMDQIPKAKGGMQVIGKRRDHDLGGELFFPPTDGVIIPNRLMDQVPRAQEGVRGEGGRFVAGNPYRFNDPRRTDLHGVVHVVVDNVDAFSKVFETAAPAQVAQPPAGSTAMPVAAGGAPLGGPLAVPPTQPRSSRIRGPEPGLRLPISPQQEAMRAMYSRGPFGEYESLLEVPSEFGGAYAERLRRAAASSEFTPRPITVAPRSMFASGTTDTAADTSAWDAAIRAGERASAGGRGRGGGPGATATMPPGEGLSFEEPSAGVARGGTGPFAELRRQQMQDLMTAGQATTTRTPQGIVAVLASTFFGGGRSKDTERVREQRAALTELIGIEDKLDSAELESYLDNLDKLQAAHGEDREAIEATIAAMEARNENLPKWVQANDDYVTAVQKGLPGLKEGVLNLGKVVVGIQAYAIAMQALSGALQVGRVAAADWVDQQRGWRSISMEATKALADQTKQQHGNVDAVLNQNSANLRLGESLSELGNGILRMPVAVQSGADAAKDMENYIKATIGVGEGVPAGTYGGFGGPFFEGAFLGRTGGSQALAGAFAALNPETYRGSGVGGKRTFLDDPIGELSEPFLDLARDIAMPFGLGDLVPRRPEQFIPDTEMLDKTRERLVTDLNAAAARGGIRFETGNRVGFEADAALAELVAAAEDIPEELRDMAEAGIVVTLNGQTVMTRKQADEAMPQAVAGLSIMPVGTWAREFSRQFGFQQQGATALTERQLTVGQPYNFWQQLAQNPLIDPRAGASYLGVSPEARRQAESRYGTATVAQDFLRSFAQQGLIQQGLEIGRVLPGERASVFQENGEMATMGIGEAYVYATNQAQKYSDSIARVTESMLESQRAAADVSYANQIRLANRALGDALGMLGEIGGTRLGYLQREQWLTSRASQSLGLAAQQLGLSSQKIGLMAQGLSLALQQRQITTNLALAQFQAPGETGEERYMRQREAIIRAGIEQRQLGYSQRQYGISQQQFGISQEQMGLAQQQFVLAGQIWSESAQRAAVDARKAITVMQAARDAEAISMAAQKEIQTAQQKMGVWLQQAAAYAARAENKHAALVNATVQALTDLADAAEDVIGKLYASVGLKPPKAHAAGIVGMATGRTGAIFGEAGTEAVAILRNPRMGSVASERGYGPLNLTININGPVVRDDPSTARLARTVADEVERVLSKKGQMLGLRAPAV